ncbi:uncharacterized protein BDZ99DRAFT_465310 [Mytilinidion resinicola]|uniref:Cenp-O kinetochore centromere component n=1 Tax=Mytilinidion resinicola TaxID=574789 RepID=A0A6A6YFQ6_9PEZI|nr:uncharacterized protein BDZ99DRAFT_465310 [Mytilinidion resinicola]KAF2807429.1 hypothetical protein BDZ99DRAFT_465310 [Mytilinidion resinicola]
MATSAPQTLDAELANLHAQIAHLRHRRANLSTTLLAHPNTSTLLNTNRPRGIQKPAHRSAASVLSKQQNHTTHSLHRALAGCTAYKVQDPDPYAVDSGRVLGVQIEVFTNGAFLPPYHILLHRPYATHPHTLKIHKHTLPPCIPLSQLARKHLPQPAKNEAGEPVQDLQKLVRAVRWETQSWHLRVAAVERLREEAGLGPTHPRAPEDEEVGVMQGLDVDANPGDVLNGYVAPARQGPRRKGQIVAVEADRAVSAVSIEWAGGLGVRMRVTKDGEVEKGVARWRSGERDERTERAVLGRIEGVVERLGGRR